MLQSKLFFTLVIIAIIAMTIGTIRELGKLRKGKLSKEERKNFFLSTLGHALISFFVSIGILIGLVKEEKKGEKK